MKESKISLHELGFIEIKLEGQNTMCVWHPEIPKHVPCWAPVSCGFAFANTVLVGWLKNTRYKRTEQKENGRNGTGTPYNEYCQEGSQDKVYLKSISSHIYNPVEKYLMLDDDIYQINTSEICVTIMQKVSGDTKNGSSVFCLPYINKGKKFDRFQLSEKQLWKIVKRALLG